MGKIVTAPTIYDRPWHEVGIFLAGGISGCDDWQKGTARRIANETPNNVVIINPRRDGDLDPTDIETAQEQITWEYNELMDADFVVFWFPSGGPCPITLFELGKEIAKCKARGSDNHMYVGCSPDYNRRLDVTIQMELAFPGFVIFDDLPEMISRLIENFGQ